MQTSSNTIRCRVSPTEYLITSTRVSVLFGRSAASLPQSPNRARNAMTTSLEQNQENTLYEDTATTVVDVPGGFNLDIKPYGNLRDVAPQFLVTSGGGEVTFTGNFSSVFEATCWFELVPEGIRAYRGRDDSTLHCKAPPRPPGDARLYLSGYILQEPDVIITEDDGGETGTGTVFGMDAAAAGSNAPIEILPFQATFDPNATSNIVAPPSLDNGAGSSSSPELSDDVFRLRERLPPVPPRQRAYSRDYSQLRELEPSSTDRARLFGGLNKIQLSRLNKIPFVYPFGNDAFVVRYINPLKIYDVAPRIIMDQGPQLLHVSGMGYRNTDTLMCMFYVVGEDILSSEKTQTR